MTAPSLHHTLIESRTVLELAASTIALPLLLNAPSGKHPVMVFPGFLAGDASTLALRKFLQVKGYRTYGWKHGRNLGQHFIPDGQFVRDDLLESVIKVVEKEKHPVHLIGWSLGGILAREVARIMPDVVASVISMGSPFNSPEISSPIAATLFRKFNSKKIGNGLGVPKNLGDAPPVPCTSIYSKSDGITHWRGCHQEGEHAHVENIRVKGSHLGLGHHPAVLWLVANRLAQNAKVDELHEWQPLNLKKMPSWVASRMTAEHI
jgi:pimeloyl-ACP methyl ester carboxylesterase